MPISRFILDQLKVVEDERERRIAVPGLSAKVREIKKYQQRRFCHTYADLLGSTRYGPASRFFLGELYSPEDFSQRDAQFARVVPALVRLFPKEISETVATLAELHALSERLDTTMGRNLGSGQIDACRYVAAWRATGCAPERDRQIQLTLEVANDLDRLTRRSMLRNSLRLMRGPARAAGVGNLQRFLEAGFDAFKAMEGAHAFVTLIGERERALAAALFSKNVSASRPEAGISSVLDIP
jgi:hypothetical protein